jgi:hypothetical protein
LLERKEAEEFWKTILPFKNNNDNNNNNNNNNNNKTRRRASKEKHRYTLKINYICNVMDAIICTYMNKIRYAECYIIWANTNKFKTTSNNGAAMFYVGVCWKKKKKSEVERKI